MGKKVFAAGFVALAAACVMGSCGHEAAVTTIAGDYAGYNDGVGGAARFISPSGIASDGASLYVCDMGFIRKVVIATGEVAAFAGGKAPLSIPSGIERVGADLYVCDWGSHTVCRIAISTGEITTIAGKAGESGSADGRGSDARFFYPRSLAADGDNLFVSDGMNHTIRMIRISTGDVKTLAGAPGWRGAQDGMGRDAHFGSPEGMTVQGDFLYVCDSENSAVRRISISSGEVTTFAGSLGSPGSEDGTGPDARFSSPMDITSDGENLYVCEAENNTIRKISISSGEVETIAGLAENPGSEDGAGSGARFHSPRGICADGGSLYVSDAENCSIRTVVVSTGEVKTLAGRAGSFRWKDGVGDGARFTSLSGLVSDGSRIFVCDYDCIRMIEIPSRTVSTLAGSPGTFGSADGMGSSAEFSSPSGMAAVGGYVFITDTLNHTVRWVKVSTGQVETLAGRAESEGSEDGTGISARFRQPTGIATDGTDLYVCDSVNHTIRRIGIESGMVTTIAGKAESPGSADGTGNKATFNYPRGIVYDGGNLYVCDMLNITVRKIVVATGAVTTLAGSAGNVGFQDGTGSAARFDLLSSIASDGSNLYVCDAGNNAIRTIEIATGKVGTFGGTARVGFLDGAASKARLFNPSGLCYAAGALFFTQPSCVRRIDLQ